MYLGGQTACVQILACHCLLCDLGMSPSLCASVSHLQHSGKNGRNHEVALSRKRICLWLAHNKPSVSVC